MNGVTISCHRFLSKLMNSCRFLPNGFVNKVTFKTDTIIWKTLLQSNQYLCFVHMFPIIGKLESLAHRKWLKKTKNNMKTCHFCQICSCKWRKAVRWSGNKHPKWGFLIKILSDRNMSYPWLIKIVYMTHPAWYMEPCTHVTYGPCPCQRLVSLLHGGKYLW